MYSLSLLPHLFLLFSFLSLWGKRKFLTGIIFSLSLILGLWFSHIDVFGLLFIAILGCFTYYYYKLELFRGRVLGMIGIFGYSVLALLHKLPGFYGNVVVKDMYLSGDSLPYSIILNFDKPMVGFFCLFLGFPLIGSWEELKRVLGTIFKTAFLGFPVILSLSFLLGYIHFDFKFPEILIIWALKNLFFTCITEEVIFRGIIQKWLFSLFRNIRLGKMLALCLASILFGIAHFPGGSKYVLLATVAGMFYGYVYWKTEKIESSVLFHFFLNFLHFLFFSYPALQSALK